MKGPNDCSYTTLLSPGAACSNNVHISVSDSDKFLSVSLFLSIRVCCECPAVERQSSLSEIPDGRRANTAYYSHAVNIRYKCFHACIHCLIYRPVYRLYSFDVA